MTEHLFARLSDVEDFVTGPPSATPGNLAIFGDGTGRNIIDGGPPGAGGGGSMDDFTLAGDAGTPQTIADGNTVTIAGGTGIDTSAGVTDTVSVALDAATQASLALADSAIQNLADLGITASAAELNFVDGVTSAIQTQLDAKQPLDADLTAIAALITTAYGRGLLTLADAAALAAEVDSFFLTAAEADALFLTPAEGDALFLTPAEGNAAYQPLDGDLTAIAALTSANDDIIQRKGGAWTNRTMAQLATDLDTHFLTPAEGNAAYQPLDADLTAIAALTTTAAGRSGLIVADPGVDRLKFWDDSASTEKYGAIADFTVEAAPAAGDLIFIQRAGTDDLAVVDWADLPGAGGGIANVVEDTTPQLGGDLDANAFDILFDDGDGIHSSTDEPLVTFSSAGGGAASATVHATDTTFPDGWANNLKLVAVDYPALWFHATTPDLGIVYAFDSSTNTFWMGEIAAGAPDDVLMWDFSNDAFYPNQASWDLGSATDPWDVGYFNSLELGQASDTTLSRVSPGVAAVEGVTILTTATGQPLDATLTALAAYNTNGLIAQTAADTFAGRTITGTANQITVAQGDGVAGNPALSLPADVIIPTILTVPNTGLHLLDTNASHDLIIAPGSNITADRTLTLTTGDANRTISLLADFTLPADPGADSGLFWDESGNITAYWTPTNGLEFNGTNLRISDNSRIRAISYVIDGGGATITTGNKRGLRIPYACTITNWSIGLDQSGSIVVDIWKDTQANYPPTVGDTITASAKPTVTTATNATSGTLTGWTTAIAAGDYLFFNVDSVTTAQYATIMLQVTQT